MPDISIPKKLEPILSADQRLIVLIGGRSSAKSATVGRVSLMKCQTEAADVLCGREYQNSIEDSVHKLLKNLIEQIPVQGFKVTDRKIDCLTGGGIRFRGFARNPEAVKSAEGFKYSWIEEAQALSQDSINVLIPTIRTTGSKLFFTANPQASNDPFSQRFIVPFKSQIDKDEYYADDMHLIIKVNYRDNPWHKELEPQRLWDYENLPRALYDHIWEGEFLDSVDNALIKPEWFDACIDAHQKLGFEPVGIKFCAHDPSDTGPDSKGFAYRHGSVVLHMEEMTTGDINQGGFWASDLAINIGADAFVWDCDGMGVGLNGQFSLAFEGKHTNLEQFKGSESPDFPDAICENPLHATINNPKTNKESLKNKRAQRYLWLRNRIYNTYLAVEHKKYINPENLISFSSDIDCLQTLRSEVCLMPIKPNGNGLFELYRKDEMKNKFKFKSPNLADSLMMLMGVPTQHMNEHVYIPKPIIPIGRGHGIRT